jgi:hypothetical protein
MTYHELRLHLTRAYSPYEEHYDVPMLFVPVPEVVSDVHHRKINLGLRRS